MEQGYTGATAGGPMRPVMEQEKQVTSPGQKPQPVQVLDYSQMCGFGTRYNTNAGRCEADFLPWIALGLGFLAAYWLKR